MTELTFPRHSNCEAFFESTVLTTVSGEWRDFTFLLIRTFVCHSLGDTAAEKTLKIKAKRKNSAIGNIPYPKLLNKSYCKLIDVMSIKLKY